MMINFIINLINYPFRKLKSFLKKKLGWLSTPVILPYRGYGNRHEFYIRGRVIEDTGLSQPDEADSIWQNLLAMVKRYASNGIADIEVCSDFGDMKRSCLTDEDGFFEINLPLNHPPLTLNEWQNLHFKASEGLPPSQKPIEATGQVLLSHIEDQFGVITDIDDTLLISHSTNFRKKLHLMLFKNAKTRLPFDGVASFYCALQSGNSGQHHNPFFYVSSSEWNLYDLLIDFCEHHKLPKGPFLLRDAEVKLSKIWKTGTGNHSHKLDKIRHILQLHEDNRFILIGDSGQRDAEIYQQFACEFPGRILTIYIRDVRPSRHEAVQAIAKKLADDHIEMLLVKDTEEAALHALQKGYITADRIRDIVAEKEENQKMSSDIGQLMERVVNPA